MLRIIILLLLASVTAVACGRGSIAETEQAVSPYYRQVNWGTFPSDADTHFCSQNETDDLFPFSAKSTSSLIYNEFESLAMDYPDYISKQTVGQASDEQDLFYFRIGQSDNTTAPTIIIVCAQHGFEKNSTFGTYFFVKAVLSGESPFLSYMRDYVNLIIVPVANPYGFDKFIYKNANQVNLNRNWPVIGWDSLTEDKDSPNYQSDSPLDQPETQAISMIISKYRNAVLLIDFHTYGGGVVENIQQINELVIPQVRNDRYFCGIFEVAANYQQRVSKLFKEKYGKSRSIFNGTPLIGVISTCDYYRKKGCLNNYGCQMNIFSLTFEGFNGFPGETASFTQEVAVANAELLGNFLYSFCEFFHDKNGIL